MQSPVGLVLKAGGQMRLIFHLSYDFGVEDHQKSLNHHTPEEDCTVHYRDLDFAIRTCLDLGLAEDGRAVGVIYFTKSDLRSAFKILPIRPSQRRWLYMMAKHPISGEKRYFQENCLPFGSSVSCARFQLFSDSLQHIVEAVTRRHFRVTNYLGRFPVHC